jgi:hypothetical protein
LLDWTNPPELPDAWQIQQSDDGVEGWNVHENVDAMYDTYSVEGIESFWRIQGVDGDGNPVTDVSNVVASHA